MLREGIRVRVYGKESTEGIIEKLDMLHVYIRTDQGDTVIVPHIQFIREGFKILSAKQ